MMTATTTSKFDTAVCAGLSAMRGGEYTAIENGFSYRSEFGDTVQVIDENTFKDHVVECYAANDNGEPTEEGMQREMEESPKMLVDYDLDEHGNRYSEFFYIVTLN